MFQKSYRECICLADEQLRQFMLLDAFETIPSKEQVEHALNKPQLVAYSTRT
jgi:hypothetical protein